MNIALCFILLSFERMLNLGENVSVSVYTRSKYFNVQPFIIVAMPLINDKWGTEFLGKRKYELAFDSKDYKR